jgi:energy-coupling factor transporter ATP-binding protein EcfA2
MQLVESAMTISPPPSRFGNPFATCWTRPGAMTFHFPAGHGVGELLQQLASNNWRGAILGPHGSGKSTLLETLKLLLRDAGRTVSSISLRDSQRSLPHGSLRDSLASSLPVVIVDGYEKLSLASRAWLHWRCRRASAGLIVTSHAPTCLPTLIELKPSRALVDQLIADLATRAPTCVTAADVAASFACHGSNVRELLFSLYSLHESRSRRERTAAADDV